MVGRLWWCAPVAALLVTACGPSIEVLEPAGDSSDGGQSGPMSGLSMGTSSGGTTVATTDDVSSDDDGPCPPPGCFDVNLPDPVCEDAADCVLYDSCCWCEAGPVGAPPPDDCPADCEVGMCTAMGVSEAACSSVLGPTLCVPARDCDAGHVECDAPPPLCPDGTLPTVVDGCWSGCIPIRSCFGVGSCGNCPEGDVCLEYPNLGLVVCVQPLDGCNEATCACLPEDVCEFAIDYCEDGFKLPGCYPAPP